MDRRYLTDLLGRVRLGDLTIADALHELEKLPFEDLGFARLDHHRVLRTGFPEIVFGESKTPEQIATILQRLVGRNSTVLCTRASPEAFAAVNSVLPQAVYHPIPRLIVVPEPDAPETRWNGITVVSAGTTDLPVAEEAALTAEAAGHAVERITDVGVAGLQRLLSVLEVLRRSTVVVAVAGMEGAMPGVIAGLVAAPVIAVPTSVGYGTSLGGLAALMTMLNSCSLGLAVVNIDNGVGAGIMAATINQLAHESPRSEGNDAGLL